MSKYESFIVKATLMNGVSIDPRFGVSLDSLLASSIREKQKRELGLSGEEYDGGLNRFVTPEVKIVPLPLSKCTVGEEWHWMATCALPLDAKGDVTSVHDVQVRSHIQIDDHPALDRSVGKLPANVSSSSGRWKLSRGITPVTLAQHLSWTGHGDIDSVQKLLESITSVGAGRKSGVGTVVAWSVEPNSASTTDAGHLGIDTKVSRPVFNGCLGTLSTPIGIDTLEKVRAGIRPPYWHLGHQHDVLINPRR